MEDFGRLHWLIVPAIILLLLGGTKISDLARRIGGGPGGPSHPLPVTSPVETSNSAEREKKKAKSYWQTLKSVLRWLRVERVD